MSGIFTLDSGQNAGLGVVPGSSGVQMGASKPHAGGAGPGTFHITLESGGGVVALQSGSGDIELEDGP